MAENRGLFGNDPNTSGKLKSAKNVKKKQEGLSVKKGKKKNKKIIEVSRLHLLS